ncbi:DUF4252 domain-containing protein [Zunongwangia sp. F363]|uniref:DUF4252 domain-containing protein n=1 Tax=Autumnicola tepida TaxID=3075595 RepID=A0ABU3CEF5_9FLAO|nr:DUF4252 domain-containing protein [Zunongwangia sp. F363]MDT0644734.1 DUF4252 domain-containing protein [Zunongwangia sp. F363]
MRAKFFILGCAVLTLVFACDNKTSLQEYYVENQEDNQFLALDVPAGMFTNSEGLDEEQRATLQTVKKINLLAYPVKDGNDKFEAEMAELEGILSDEKYQLLIKYGSGERKAEVYFTGDEDAVDELIVYGYDKSKGLGVARVLGDNMNPGDLLKLMNSMKKGDVNVEGLSAIGDVFMDSHQTAEPVEIPADTMEVAE